MAVGILMKENRWQSILGKGRKNLFNWPLTTPRTGVRSGAGVIITRLLMVLLNIMISCGPFEF